LRRQQTIVIQQQEGVVKFQLQYAPSPALPDEALRELNAWRRMLFMNNLIGQDPARYGGFGYGNVSQRLEPRDPSHPRRFTISGTQTGGLAELNASHYAIVLECWPDRNTVLAEGPIQPSSESLTHGTLYELDDSIRFVLHAHSPHIWRHARELDIPTTCAGVAYGTPQMADEVRRLYRESDARARGIFAMGGHEDGVLTFSHSAAEAGCVMLAHLARALALEG
jgi:L-ribulose-5-phosphate 4-epimerase